MKKVNMQPNQEPSLAAQLTEVGLELSEFILALEADTLTAESEIVFAHRLGAAAEAITSHAKARTRAIIEASADVLQTINNAIVEPAPSSVENQVNDNRP